MPRRHLKNIQKPFQKRASFIASRGGSGAYTPRGRMAGRDPTGKQKSKGKGSDMPSTSHTSSQAAGNSGDQRLRGAHTSDQPASDQENSQIRIRTYRTRYMAASDENLFGSRVATCFYIHAQSVQKAWKRRAGWPCRQMET